MLTPPLKILADENLPGLQPLFAELGELVTAPGRHLAAADLHDVDVLLVRSVTQVRAELLQGSSVRFVGTATIGTDHVDQAYLAEQGIAFHSAPGCNAEAVVDYTLNCLWQWCQATGRDLAQQRVGILGVGNVGSRLAQRLQALGCELGLCDPPRQRREGGDWQSLAEILRESDIVCLHTPLTREGEDATWHLFDEAALLQLRPGACVLNAGRGAVISAEAMLKVATARPDLSWILDVWEQEPQIDPQLLSHAFIATPHIAGYSLEGKVRGSWMLAQALYAWLGLPFNQPLSSLLPEPAVAAVHLNADADPSLPMRLIYDPFQDDRALRALFTRSPEERALGFDRLRREYPVRREFSSLTLSCATTQLPRLHALGFSQALSSAVKRVDV